MKIRTGFVSNSSSSSFVIIGNKINKNDVNAKLKVGKTIYGVCLNGGYSGDAADFIISFSFETFSFLKNYHKTLELFDFYESIIQVDNDNDAPNVEIIDNCDLSVFNFRKDYSSCNDIINFKKWLNI